MCCRSSQHCILPPYILDHMTKSSDPKVRRLAVDAIANSAEARAARINYSTMAIMAAIPSPAQKKHRLIYDMKNKPIPYLPGTLVRSEGDPASQDPAVNEAYNYSGYTYDFYWRKFGRNSLDGNGMALLSSVHVGSNFNNAFWNGEQMAYGDGDGQIFIRFTKAIDVVGHELTHGVVMHTSNLEYRNEPGALNEHLADVMGSLVKQWRKKQTAAQADWLIGDAIMGPAVEAKSLRTLKGEKAYVNDPVLGTDPQPKHMKDKYTGTADYGGVHINSGIPNHAFYLTAMEIGGKAWQKAGRIWYKTMLNLNRFSSFQDAAAMTIQVAGAEYGPNSSEQKAVKAAWKAVGL